MSRCFKCRKELELRTNVHIISDGEKYFFCDSCNDEFMKFPTGGKSVDNFAEIKKESFVLKNINQAKERRARGE